jgi:hypothetical protein
MTFAKSVAGAALVASLAATLGSTPALADVPTGGSAASPAAPTAAAAPSATEPAAASPAPGPTAWPTAPPPPAASPTEGAPPATPPVNVVAAAPPPSKGQEPSLPLLGFVERLPPSAYPSEPIRGIEGGSLWRIFHGLQWPYYPKTGIGVSGDLWVDSSYQHTIRRLPNEPNGRGLTEFLQQGRQVLRFTPTWSGGEWFVQGQTELVANEDQGQAQPNGLFVTVDDLWLRAGKWKKFDVQVGRLEGWEIYHFGMALDLHTAERVGPNAQTLAPQIYGVTALMYRPQSFGAGAVHLYPTDWLRFEIEGRYGNEAAQNGLGGRAVGIVDLGWMKIKGGAEYEDLSPEADSGKGDQKTYGAGGALQFVFDPWVEFGVNGAYGWQTTTDPVSGNPSPAQSFQTYSLGAFANAHVIGDLIVAGGINYTYYVDQEYDATLRRTLNRDNWQGFGALQYTLWKQLYIKGVVGYALANFNPIGSNVSYFNTMISGRLRLELLF